MKFTLNEVKLFESDFDFDRDNLDFSISLLCKLFLEGYILVEKAAEVKV